MSVGHGWVDLLGNTTAFGANQDWISVVNGAGSAVTGVASANAPSGRALRMTAGAVAGGYAVARSTKFQAWNVELLMLCAYSTTATLGYCTVNLRSNPVHTTAGVSADNPRTGINFYQQNNGALCGLEASTGGATTNITQVASIAVTTAPWWWHIRLFGARAEMRQWLNTAAPPQGWTISTTLDTANADYSRNIAGTEEEDQSYLWMQVRSDTANARNFDIFRLHARNLDALPSGLLAPA